MKRVNTLLAAVLTVAAIDLGAAHQVQAHGPGANGANQPYGWHMGPMMDRGQMGPGMMQPVR